MLPNALEERDDAPYDDDHDDDDDDDDDAIDAGAAARDAGATADAELETDASASDEDASAPLAMDAAVPPQDASPGFDAADTTVGVADTSIADTSIGSADTSTGATDTGVADTSTGPLDAAANDASQPATGIRVVVDNTTSSTLRDFPVLVRLDTRTLIQQGRLAADCSNLRISGSTDCGQARSFFLPAHGCNSATSELWLRVPQLSGGASEVFAVSFATSGEASSGSRVFPFFDDFTGSSLDTARWIARGGGSVTVSGGVLQSQGIMQLESVTRAVSAGQSIVGARMAALGAYDTDVELGAGVVSADNTIWAPGRAWDGVTLVSHDFGTYAFDGPAGTACDNLANHSPTPQIGATWLDSPPTTASFLIAEFGYALRSGTAEGWLRTSRGASLTYTAPSGCGLPTTLPVLITLDHNTPDAPVQRVDYVYVRPSAANEPSTSVLSASALACGAAP